MRTVVVYPGNMSHAQHAARALYEANALGCYVTSFVYNQRGLGARFLKAMPFDVLRSADRQLSRRSITEIPSEFIRTLPILEVCRTVLARLGGRTPAEDAVWDLMIHRFDEIAARRFVPSCQAVLSFEYGALACFQRAKLEGKAKILHLPSLDTRQFEAIQSREKAAWPELADKHEAYFASRFERRYERRQQELALADMVICNSSLTARSHIAAGVDAAKVFVVPLGAPPAITEVEFDTARRAGPAIFIYAGPFSLRKGAHYLLEAWRLLNPGNLATLHVYGQIALPERLLAQAPESIIFHQSVPRGQLFEAYRTADALVFPTLSDGFGMVVAEAMANGLPVITTDQAGAADLVTPENGRIVAAADAKALAEELRWCLDNRNKLAQMRFNALETARRRQWSDFRVNHISALREGLSRAGYHPNYKNQGTQG